MNTLSLTKPHGEKSQEVRSGDLCSQQSNLIYCLTQHGQSSDGVGYRSDTDVRFYTNVVEHRRFSLLPDKLL